MGPWNISISYINIWIEYEWIDSQQIIITIIISIELNLLESLE